LVPSMSEACHANGVMPPVSHILVVSDERVVKKECYFAPRSRPNWVKNVNPLPQIEVSFRKWVKFFPSVFERHHQ
jgi:hypothetical protein